MQQPGYSGYPQPQPTAVPAAAGYGSPQSAPAGYGVPQVPGAGGPASVPVASPPPSVPQAGHGVPQPAVAQAAAERVPAMEDLFAFAVERGASDIHVVAGQPPMARVSGELAPIPGLARLTPQTSRTIVGQIMTEEQRRRLEVEREVDFSYTFGEKARFRINAFHQRGSVSAALRLIPMNPVPLEDLDLPQAIKGFAGLRDGLVLITGPTGSGKSTTLAALIDKINRDRSEHIVTVEDPIEFHHQHKRSVVQQREVESDTPSFARALKSILRQDPDVVLIGEMRDLETISAAVTTAETGHLVFATLHTNTAASAVDRIIDVFPSHQQSQIRSQLSSSLRAVTAQRLLPGAAGGRYCVAEILISNPAIANLIREGKTHQIQSIMQTSRSDGMVTFDAALATAVRGGKVKMEDAMPLAVDQDEFRKLAGRG